MYKNKLLLASPLITDPVFAGSAIFICEHTKNGAHGIIVNSKEIGVVGFGEMQDLFNAAPGNFDEVKNLILDGKLKSVPLFSGGPCSSGVFFIHGHEELHQLNEHEEHDEKPEYDLGIPTSFNIFDEQNEYQDSNPAHADRLDKMKIIDGIYFGLPYTFGNLIESGKLSENRFKFFTGMSAWGAGQLEYEVKNGAWTVAEFSQDKLPDLFFYPEKLKDISGVSLEAVSLKKKYSWLPNVSNNFDSTWN